MATRDRPRPGWKRLDAVMAPFEALSVEALARAALDSPSASHWAAATGLNDPFNAHAPLGVRRGAALAAGPLHGLILPETARTLYQRH